VINDPLRRAGVFSPRPSEGDAWPTETQLEIIHFSLGENIDHFTNWVEQHAPDTLDSGGIRLLPYLFHQHIKKLPNTVPHYFILSGLWKKSFYENITHWRLTLPALNALQEAHIKVTLIKGCALSALLYKDWGSRPMADIDILISVHDVHQACTILNHWQQHPTPPEPYAAGTWGPASAQTLITRDGFQWHENINFHL
jgi:hypothetical protein